MDHLTLILRHLEAGDRLPDDLRLWLAGALRRVLHGCPAGMAFRIHPVHRRQERDRLLQTAVAPIEGSLWHKAAWAARQVSLLRQGRSADPVIEAADRIWRLPQTQRQLYNLLKTETV